MAAVPAAAQVDQERAAAYFREAAALCEREGGRLWDVSLCGPMAFADPGTGTIATNRPVPDGPRPRVLGYANAAVEWGHTRWAVYVWQMIPEDESARARMMLHELFHRVQTELGLYRALLAGENEHLDTPAGRYWLRLEWRALARALRTTGAERTEAVRHALAFRAARRVQFASAAEQETGSEINEGLAQYTATVAAASSGDAAARDAVEQLVEAERKESFVRTFAYASGTAYGVLLDAWRPGWTRRVTTADDLGELLRRAAGIQPAESAAVVAAHYDGPELWAAEEEREAARRARIAELRRRFVDGPVLVLPRGRGASFITTGLTPLRGAGTLYPRYRVTGEWGSIEAEQVLVSPDGTTLTVPGPVAVDGAIVSGDGWRIALAPGWTVESDGRPGDCRVIREAP